MIRRLLAVPALAAAMLAVGGPATASAGTMTLGAYSGLGAWIDIYDGNLMKTPDRTAAALKARGVNTIYLETGNSSAKDAFVRPAAAASLIQSAHRRGMKVVAWYLPTLVDQGKDQRRALGAIRFRTPLGQSFDGFALDIESPAVRTVSIRNARLLAVSAYLRRLGALRGEAGRDHSGAARHAAVADLLAELPVRRPGVDLRHVRPDGLLHEPGQRRARRVPVHVDERADHLARDRRPDDPACT